jgi:PAS domain S-box-containing protein
MISQTPREILRTFVPLIVVAVLLTLFLTFHIFSDSLAIGTTEWVLEVSLAAVALVSLAYGERLRRILMREWDSRERLSLAQRVSGVGSWERDLRTNELRWSAETYRILGVDPKERITFDRLWTFVHPEDRDGLARVIADLIRNGEMAPFRYRVTRSDGALRVVLSHGRTLLERGVPVRVIGSVQDITEQHAAETALRASEERFQLAALASHGVIWDWNIASGDIWWSDGFERLFGYPDVPQRNTHAFRTSLIHDTDLERVTATFEDARGSSGRFWTAEYRCRRADGTYMDVLDRAYLVRDDAGAPVRMIGSMMDITGRKAAERLKNDFVSFATHQLRTPLSGIRWMLELALDAGGMAPRTEEFVRGGHDATGRLTRMVNELLDAARLESGQISIDREALPLADLTRQIAAEFAPLFTQKSLQVSLDLERLVPIVGDPRLLREAIENLLSNAVKYTPAGGRVEISLAVRDGQAIWMIRDNGIGVPADARKRLFEKFFRASNVARIDTEGTGLGLHLVKLIVERHQGRVWFEPNEGIGTTFAFAVPCEQEVCV